MTGRSLRSMTSDRCEHKRRSRANSTCPSALRTVEQPCHLLPPEPPSPLTLGAASSYPFQSWRSPSLSPCTRPSYVFRPNRPTLELATYLQSVQGKPISFSLIRIPAAASASRPCSEQCRYRGCYSDGNVQPGAFAHPEGHSHPALRWQRKISLLHPPQFTNGNRSSPIEFAGRTLKIFFARLGPFFGQMSH